MSSWRRIALETFPALHRSLAGAGGAGLAWLTLFIALCDAYRQEPPDEEFIADVYGYASWCLHHRSFTVQVAVISWFYERLPGEKRLRADMPRWLSQGDFEALEGTWAYALADEDLQDFRQEFALRKAGLGGAVNKKQRNKLNKLGYAVRPDAAPPEGTT